MNIMDTVMASIKSDQSKEKTSEKNDQYPRFKYNSKIAVTKQIHGKWKSEGNQVVHVIKILFLGKAIQ